MRIYRRQNVDYWRDVFQATGDFSGDFIDRVSFNTAFLKLFE